MNTRVLITGGAGFIGRHLAHRMLKEGLQVSIYDSFSAQIHGDLSPQEVLGELWQACEVVRGDVRDKEALGRAMEGQSVVVHLAAETGTGQSMYEVERYVDVNSRGTAVLLDLVANGAKDVERIVVASSRAVYGEGSYECPDHGLVSPRPRSKTDLDLGDFAVKCPTCGISSVECATSESAKLHPTSIYGITKLNQEQMVLVEADALGIPGVALRYQNVYGPGQSLNNPYTGILSIFSRLLQAGKEINIFEDGLESRDFVYIDDVVDATFQAVVGGRGVTGAFNVGTGVKTSVAEVANTLKQVYGSSSTLRVSGDYRMGDIRHNFAELSESVKALNFHPKVGFAEGITAFSNWVLAQERDVTGGLAYEKSLHEMRARGLMK